ncbi:MAG: hypothetical protein Q8R02_23255 [Hyphomonadaceae bacterium]|nr:hypothetical protein [Hyphomonadaceae bacterium]
MSAPLMILPPSALKAAEVARARKALKGLYADHPGTGPAGETCGSCKNLYRKHMGKTYLKCSLTEKFWTGGGGTDIKARSPACSKWEAEGQAEGQRESPKG